MNERLELKKESSQEESVYIYTGSGETRANIAHRLLYLGIADSLVYNYY